MIIPTLKRSNRKREYDLYNQNQIDKVVYKYLFDGVSHRKLDQDVLGLVSADSRGYQAMGILHYLGITKEFKDLFSGIELEKAIELLLINNLEHFSEIIESFKRTSYKMKTNKNEIELS